MINQYPYPLRIEQVDGGFIVSDADIAHANKKVHSNLDSALQDIRQRIEGHKK